MADRQIWPKSWFEITAATTSRAPVDATSYTRNVVQVLVHPVKQNNEAFVDLALLRVGGGGFETNNRLSKRIVMAETGYISKGEYLNSFLNIEWELTWSYFLSQDTQQ